MRGECGKIRLVHSVGKIEPLGNDEENLEVREYTGN